MAKKKKHAKRGRPRIKGCLREPNGRILRAKMPREPVNKLIIEMRAKHFGLTVEEAKNPLSSTYIGRLCLLGYGQDPSGISQDQYDAAQKYLEVRNDYLCAKGLPSAIYDEVPTTSDGEAREKWVKFAEKQFLNIQEIVKETQVLYRQHNLYAALQYLVNSLRIVLNALHKYFDEDGKK
ncbi:hypothetical protein V3565_02245 [Bartonella sp. B10]